MDSRKVVLRETGIIAIGEAIGVALMYGVFAIIGKFDLAVLLGGLAGGILSILNFFFMAVNLDGATKKAVNQEVKQGKSMVRSSYMLRLLMIFALLFVLVKSGLCNAFACVIPFVFVRITITVAEFFRKPEEK